MDIRQLRYFVGVVEAGSFTRASEQLHVAQSALSLHVKSLEDRFGLALLIRDRNGVRVTPKGARLLEHAQIILRQMALADAELSEGMSAPFGVVNIGIPPAAARLLVPKLLARSREKLPGVTLKISEGLTIALREWMTSGKLNMKIAYRTPATVERSLEIAREDFCLIVRANDPAWAGRETVALGELRRVPLAVPMPTHTPGTVANVVADHRDELNVAFEVDSLPTIINLVLGGQACTILTASAIQHELRDGLVKALRIVDPTIVRSVVIVTNMRDELDRAVIATRSFLAEAVRDLVREGAWPATLCEDAEAASAGALRYRR